MRQLSYVIICVVGISWGSFPAAGDVITVWNQAVLEAVRNESTSPPLAARNLAIVHAAIFDAVNAVERQYEAYLFQPNPSAGALAEAAAIGAAYHTLIGLYPSQQALFDQTLNRTLAAITPGQARDDGFTLGHLVALLMLVWRNPDGASTTVPYIPGTNPGDWQRTPPTFRPPELPQWLYVIPFTMTNGAQFRPFGPPSLTSTQYTRDFNLTKELGGLNSTKRTPEQTLIARFWSDFSFTVTPPGHWNQIAQNVATNSTNTVVQNARLFALLNLAMADGGIASWDAKYVYDFWRPVTAIRQADTDGNPDTEMDASWTPLLNTPPFPEYVSGHSTFSGGAAIVLALFHGTDNITFTVGSDTVAGVLRTYDSFEAASEEIGLSRIYGGIHFLSADLDGLDIGHRLGNYVYQNCLRPLSRNVTIRIARAGDGELEVNLLGPAGGRYALESSGDLTHWAPIVTNSLPYLFEIFEEPGLNERFFRAVLVE